MVKILVIDEGTSSTRAAVFDENLTNGEFTQFEIPLISPSPHIVEQDANLIWRESYKAAKIAISNNDIDAIGITNQRETTILWNKNTGIPVHNAIIWQDRRGADFCDYLKNNNLEKIIINKTGLLADPYFSAFKIRYLLENIKGLRESVNRGEILFGNVDTWLIWNLTKGKSHVTDYSNASRSAIFNINEGIWDDELLNIFDIPKSILPKVLPSNAHFGDCELFGKTIPIKGVLGDQQAALMGQNCFTKGQAKITFGTGAFLMVQMGENLKLSSNKLLSTIAFNIDNKTNYAIEGAILNAGTSIKWLRDNLQIINSSDETAKIAQSIEINEGVYFVPSFTGLGAPYWNAKAQGTIIGLGRGSNKAHFVRAALEAAAYQTYDLLNAIIKDGIEINILRIDGGMAANDFFCQFLADICDLNVERPSQLEMTAKGAAYIALIGLGFEGQIKQNMNFQIFKPKMQQKLREENLKGWQKAIAATLKAI